MSDGLERPLPVSSDGPSALEPRLRNWVDCAGAAAVFQPCKAKAALVPWPGCSWGPVATPMSSTQSQGKGRQAKCCTFLTLENL